MRSGGKRRLRFGWARGSLRAAEPDQGSWWARFSAMISISDLSRSPTNSSMLRPAVSACTPETIFSLTAVVSSGAKIPPPAFHRFGELIQEMANSARAAGKMESQMRAHQRPTQARSFADRSVDIRDIGDALGEEMDRLPP